MKKLIEKLARVSRKPTTVVLGMFEKLELKYGKDYAEMNESLKAKFEADLKSKLNIKEEVKTNVKSFLEYTGKVSEFLESKCKEEFDSSDIIDDIDGEDKRLKKDIQEGEKPDFLKDKEDDKDKEDKEKDDDKEKEKEDK